MKHTLLYATVLLSLLTACSSSIPNEVELKSGDYAKGNVFGLYMGAVTYNDGKVLYFQDRGMKMCLYNPETKMGMLLIGTIQNSEVSYTVYNDVNYDKSTYFSMHTGASMPDVMENYATDEYKLESKGFKISTTTILNKTCKLYSFSDNEKYRATFRGVTFGFRMGVTDDEHITHEHWYEATSISYDNPSDKWFDTTKLTQE